MAGRRHAATEAAVAARSPRPGGRVDQTGQPGAGCRAPELSSGRPVRPVTAVDGRPCARGAPDGPVRDEVAPVVVAARLDAAAGQGARPAVAALHVAPRVAAAVADELPHARPGEAVRRAGPEAPRAQPARAAAPEQDAPPPGVVASARRAPRGGRPVVQPARRGSLPLPGARRRQPGAARPRHAVRRQQQVRRAVPHRVPAMPAGRSAGSAARQGRVPLPDAARRQREPEATDGRAGRPAGGPAPVRRPGLRPPGCGTACGRPAVHAAGTAPG